MKRPNDSFIDREHLNLDDKLTIATDSWTGIDHINKFGGGCEAAADTITDVWDDGASQPVYPWATVGTAPITRLAQAVDQVTFRGQSITIEGVDENWNQVVQEASLNALDTTTPVILFTPLMRVYRMSITSRYTGASDVFITNTAGTTKYAVIQAGNNQTLMAVYTVPAGKTAYMTGFYASVVDATNKTPTSTDVRVWFADKSVITAPAGGYEWRLKMATAIPSGTAIPKHEFNPYYKITEKSDVKITMTPADEPGYCYAGFDLILVDN